MALFNYAKEASTAIEIVKEGAPERKYLQRIILLLRQFY